MIPRFASVTRDWRQATGASAAGRRGPHLVVSVKNRAEALDAVRAGAHVIDVKDPSRGALGCADAHVFAEIAAAVQGRLPVSAAMGETVDWTKREVALRHWFSIARGAAFAKFGPARLGRHRQWYPTWNHLRACCPKHVHPVAVVYADWRHAEAPGPAQVIDAASDMGCGLVLIDTHGKARGDLFTVWPRRELADAIARVRRHGMGLVLGGSISLDSLATAVHLQPDFIAVRGAVCAEGRRSDLSAARVVQFADRLECLARDPRSATPDTRAPAVKRSMPPSRQWRVWGGAGPPNR